MTEIADAKLMLPSRRLPRLKLPALSGAGVLVTAAALLGLLLLALAILAPLVSPFEPDQQRLLARLKPPVGLAGANPLH